MEQAPDNFRAYVADLKKRSKSLEKIFERFNDLAGKAVIGSVGLWIIIWMIILIIDWKEDHLLLDQFINRYGLEIPILAVVGSFLIFIVLLTPLIDRVWFYPKKQEMGRELASFIDQTPDFDNMISILSFEQRDVIRRMGQYLPPQTQLPSLI